MEDNSAMACMYVTADPPSHGPVLLIYQQEHTPFLPSPVSQTSAQVSQYRGDSGAEQVCGQTLQKHTGRYSIKWATSHAVFICGQHMLRLGAWTRCVCTRLNVRGSQVGPTHLQDGYLVFQGILVFVWET